MASAARIVELIRTNDPVLLSWSVALLAESEIESGIFDAHTSLLEGSVVAIQHRPLVAAADEARARMIIAEAEVV